MGALSIGGRRFTYLDWDKTPGTIYITDNETGIHHYLDLRKIDDAEALHELIDLLIWVAEGNTRLNRSLAEQLAKLDTGEYNP